MNKALLIGGSGYLGRHLQEEFSSNWEVFFTSRKTNQAANCIQLDLNDSSTFENLLGRNFDLAVILVAQINGLQSTP